MLIGIVNKSYVLEIFVLEIFVLENFIKYLQYLLTHKKFYSFSLPNNFF